MSSLLLTRLIQKTLYEAWNPVTKQFDTVTTSKEGEEELTKKEKYIKRNASPTEFSGNRDSQFEDEIEDLRKSPEFKTLEKFVEFKFDDEQETFNALELQALARNLDFKTRGLKNALPPASLVTQVKNDLIGYGLRFEPRQTQKFFRGAMSNSHGSHPFAGMSGGSGFTEVPVWLHSKKEKPAWDANDSKNLPMGAKRK